MPPYSRACHALLRGLHRCRALHHLAPPLVLPCTRPCTRLCTRPFSLHMGTPPVLPRLLCTHAGGGQGSGEAAPRLHMVFTCARCETRAVKSFSRRAYERGVVLVTCPGCGGRHVIADHLGWFGEEKDIEEVLRKRGEQVVRITDADLDFTP